jgi:hypothetical protein
LPSVGTRSRDSGRGGWYDSYARFYAGEYAYGSDSGGVARPQSSSDLEPNGRVGR